MQHRRRTAVSAKAQRGLVRIVRVERATASVGEDTPVPDLPIRAHLSGSTSIVRL